MEDIFGKRAEKIESKLARSGNGNGGRRKIIYREIETTDRIGWAK
jgi:hypothetical protein